MTNSYHYYSASHPPPRGGSGGGGGFASVAVTLVLVVLAFVLAGVHAQQSVPAGTTPVGVSPLRGGAQCLLPRHHKSHPQVPPRNLWGETRLPLPTNDWWTNLATATLNRAGTSPIKPWPLMVRPSVAANGFDVSLPTQMTQDRYTTDTFVFNVALGARETLSSRSVQSFSKLHATMRFTGAGSSRIDFPILRGMPYLTAIYGGGGLRPRFTTIHAILRINGRGFAQGTSYEATDTPGSPGVGKWRIELNSGQTWMLYSMQGSGPLRIRADGPTTLVAEQTWNGVLRLAGVSGSAIVGGSATDAEALLDRHAGTYATSGRVLLSVKGGATTDSATGEKFDAGVITYDWQTAGPGSANDLIMYAMPHHLDMLTDVPRVLGMAESANANRIALRHATVRGVMHALRGSRWVLVEPRLTNTGFFAKFNLPNDAARNEVADAIRADIRNGPGGIAGDPYFGGKQIAKMARVAIIAKHLGMDAEAAQARGIVKELMEPWFQTDTGDRRRLRYEHSYGGIVSHKALDDAGAEFGMGWYNDHHFHLGYFVYASAVILRDEPNWRYRDIAIDLVRDFASPKADAHFPEARNKDWYTGYSHANGLFDFADSKNQESTSEAVNAYYAVTVFARAVGDRQLMDFGRLMLATEIRGAQKYWHMPSWNDIYPERFRANKVVGVLWSSKSEYATFFGPNVEFIHGIQYIPFIPVSDELLPARYLRDAWPVVSTAFTRRDPPLSEGWRGLLYLAQCIFDKQAGLANVRRLRGYDDGNTRTNTLYTCLTVSESGLQPSPEPAPEPIGPPPTPGPEPVPPGPEPAPPSPLPSGSIDPNATGNATNATDSGDVSAASPIVSWGTVLLTMFLMFSLFLVNKIGIHYFYAQDVPQE